MNYSNKGTIFSKSSDLYIASCEFSSNYALEGPAIYFNLSSPAELSIFSTIFSYNSANKGTIYVANPSGTPGLLLLLLNLCKFVSNQATSGAGVFIESKVLTNSSQIANSLFQSNQGSFLGVLVVNENPILINACEFSDNIAKQAVVLYSIKDSLQAVIALNSLLISNNIGNSIILSESINVPPVLLIDNSAFINNTGVCLSLSNSFLVLNNSYCIANTNTEAACILLIFSSTGIVANCLIQYNMCEISGAIKVSSSSFIQCDNCTFDTNYANHGGAILFSDGGHGNITDSKFISNISPYYGPAIFMVDSGANKMYVTNSLFQNNIVGISGVISFVQSVSIVENCNFTSNIAVKYSPGVSTSMSNITISGCNFFNQSGYFGSFISLATLSFAEITDCNFELGYSVEGGSIIIATSLAIITGCSFRDTSAINGGVISVNTQAQAILTSVNVYNSTASGQGGVIYNAQSTVQIYYSRFELFAKTGIYADKAALIEIIGTQFSNGSSSEDGGGVMCVSCVSIIISYCSFIGMSAVNGGSLSMYYQQNQPKPTCFIEYTMFMDSKAQQGGAIFTIDYNVTIENSSFVNNSAVGDIDLWGSAGGVYSNCDINQDCSLTVKNNEFLMNSAKELGGCITWRTTKPELSENTYINNSAIYGNEIASFPISMSVYSSDTFLTDFSLSDIAPGQLVSNSFSVVLLDHYGQIVKTDNTTTISLTSPSSDIIISGTTTITSSLGMVTFGSFYIYGKPGNNISMEITSPVINSTNYISVPLFLRKCLIGETFSNNACVICSKGQYSIDPNGPCLECLTEAVCYGNYTMVPKSGYWRSSMFSSIFYQCPLLEACIGGGDNNSLTGECKVGYWSNLCQACSSGYSRGSGGVCQKCPDIQENIAYLSLIIIIIVLCICLLVYINISLADKPPSNYTILIKILMNYIQIISIVASFNFEWPDFALEYLKIQETAGSLSQQSFSFDCFISEKYGRTNSEVYFDKLLLYLLMPLAIITGCLFLWAIVSLIKLDSKYIRNHFIGSIVIIIFILHSVIIKISLAPFSCKEIGNGEFWLNDDLSVKCWEGRHTLYTLAVALPGILIWGIIIPVFGIFITFRNRKNFDQLEVKQKYGFIISGYNYEHYYWEFVIIYRKVFVISCSLFFGSLSVELQTLSVLIILLVTSYMQAMLKPFISFDLNKMEFRSILVSIITIYCGLYYLAPDMTFTGRVILFVVLIFFNSVFFGYWIYFFLKDFAKSVVTFVVTFVKKRKGTVLPGEPKEEDLNISPIETSENNIIEEDKDFEPGNVDEDQIREGKRVNAFTVVETRRDSVDYIRPNMRNTVRYNAFNDESFGLSEKKSLD